MDKPRSRRPDDGARARRRSLVELTAAVSRTIDEGLSEMPLNPVAVPQSEQAAKTPAHRTYKAPAHKAPIRETLAHETPSQMAAPAAVNGVAQPSAHIQNASASTDLAVEVAKDMQARALEIMKAGVHVALDYTKDLANRDSNLLEGPAAECHAIVLEMMKVNAGAALHYTRELSRARTVSEMIELSSTHMRKQCEVVLQQAELLKSLTAERDKDQR